MASFNKNYAPYDEIFRKSRHKLGEIYERFIRILALGRFPSERFDREREKGEKNFMVFHKANSCEEKLIS